MDEDAPHQMRWLSVAARVAGSAVLAVGLYVLSAGPAIYFFAQRSPVVERVFKEFYAPLSWSLERTDLWSMFWSYSSWWFELPGGPGERMLRQSTPLPAVNEPGPAESIP